MPELEFNTDELGIPIPSDKNYPGDTSERLHRYLLELDTHPGKHPSSLVVSEKRDVHERRLGGGLTPGLEIITADGKKTFHSYSSGAGQGRNFVPVMEPVKLRVGWAVWLREELMGTAELNVRIYLTKGEAEACIVLHGG